MRLNKLVMSVAAMAVVGSGLMADSSAMDVEKVFEKECQGCHGPNHEGGVGSDLRPAVTAKKNAYDLSNTILNGKAGTAMPGFKEKFSKADADKMVDYIQHFKGKKIDQLTLEAVKGGWKNLNDRMEFFKKYPNPADVKKNTDICFVTERDAERVAFVDGTNGKILSKHPAGFAVHVTVTNKRQPRYAYSISRSGLVTMFDLNTPGQQKIAECQVGSESRGLAVSPDGKFLMAGNYVPGGAVLMDAMTLEPLKVYPTSSVIKPNGDIDSSRVAGIFDTPYGPYIAFALKDGGHVYIVDYSKPNYPIVGDIPNIGDILHDGFLNEGKEIGRYLFIASQGSDVVGVVDFKTKSLVTKIYTGPASKPHPGQGSSWYNETLGQQLGATVNMNLGQVTIWDDHFDVIRHIPTGGGGLFIGTSEHTPFLWADNVLGASDVWNQVHLINKQTLELDRIITVGTTEGTVTDPVTHKVLYKWEVPTVKDAKGVAVVPRILHAEPANHGHWTMISEWNAGRIGIYEATTGKFVKYITGLTTPTFTYSIEHRQTIPGA
ncbi:MAG: cytochrome D1 domain-containing protein [Sulfurimonas sp.]|uniref:nitrite reductase n=1 Tax=Sulfurimonas sp. TaxID=2022749 RepID=UPI0026223AC0|nr:nitrite reductase [Sulfurimonas sp.]MDD5401162.1 cytochrome D1 domain-containing protein [Sulfurimonas sp.]